MAGRSRFEFYCGDRREPCRDLDGRRPVPVLVDDDTDPLDELQSLVEQHVTWMDDECWERSWIDCDISGKGAVLICLDAGGSEDDLVASLRYVGPEFGRCSNTLELVF